MIITIKCMYLQDDGMEVATFLLNCTSTLPNAEEISAQLLGGGDDDEDDDDDEEDEEMEDDAVKGKAEKSAENVAEDAKPAALAEVAKPAAVNPQAQLLQSIQNSQPNPVIAANGSNEIEVSCINPRGKFLLSTYKSGIVLTNPKKRDEEQIPISSANVKHAVWFRKPEDYKKAKQQFGSGGGKKGKDVPGHLVLICLDEGDGGIVFRNKPLKQVCFQLPSYPPPSSSSDDNAAGGDSSKQLREDDWWNCLNSALFSGTKDGQIIRVGATMDRPGYKAGGGGFVFRSEGESGSTTTTEGMPFVGCYQGFNDGAMFPLREGLLFFK